MAVGADTVAATAFGSIEGSVGEFDQVYGISGIIRKGGDAHADGDSVSLNLRGVLSNHWKIMVLNG